MHGVDAVPAPALLHFRGSAERASDVRAEMKAVGPGLVLLRPAARTFKYGGIAKLLQETPMNSAQKFPTFTAVVHYCLCYSAISGRLQLGYREFF